MKKIFTIINLFTLSLLTFNTYAKENEELYRKHEEEFRKEHFIAVRNCHNRGGEFVLTKLPNGALLYECQVPQQTNETNNNSNQ